MTWQRADERPYYAPVVICIALADYARRVTMCEDMTKKVATHFYHGDATKRYHDYPLIKGSICFVIYTKSLSDVNTTVSFC